VSHIELVLLEDGAHSVVDDLLLSGSVVLVS
jgi:hypothetical protein